MNQIKIVPNFLELTINTFENDEIVPDTVQSLKYNQRTESFVDVYGSFGEDDISHNALEKYFSKSK